MSGRHEPLGPRHPEVQRLRLLLRDRNARQEQGAFVVEGRKVIEQARAAGAVEIVYGEGGRPLAPGVLERIADTTTPQPALALCRAVDVPLGTLGDGLVVVLVGVNDPGNAGSILRSAVAMGASGVVFAADSVDPMNPKTVRASAGSLFQVPVVVEPSPLDALGRMGFRRLGADMAGHPCTEVDLGGKVALVLGNEAHGLPPDLPLDGRISVPMAGPVESLNVAMAATILCYEVMRQRG
jgi:TrmH family RNA methyltransferase